MLRVKDHDVFNVYCGASPRFLRNRKSMPQQNKMMSRVVTWVDLKVLILLHVWLREDVVSYE